MSAVAANPWESALDELAVALGGDAPLSGALAPFDRLLSGGLLRERLNERLAVLAAGATSSERLTRPEYVTVAFHPGVRVRARIVRPGDAPRATIAMLSRHTMVGNNGRTPLVVQRYRQPRPEPNDVFDPRRTIDAPSPLRLLPGDALALTAAADGFELVAEDGPGVALIADGPNMVPLRWHHDRATRKPVRAEPSRTTWLRVRELIRYAALIGEPSSAAALAELTAHPSHFIRWAAARTALKIDRTIGRAAMERLVDDPHPQLRDAARAILAGASA